MEQTSVFICFTSDLKQCFKGEKFFVLLPNYDIPTEIQLT